MVRKRLLQTSICLAILLQSACDEPSATDAPAAQQPPLAESKATIQTSSAYSIPNDEPTHAQAIQHLLSAPKNSSKYAEQVKRLCLSYLKQYKQNSPARESALECLVHTMQQMPERFSGTDFDKAKRYCEEAEGSPYEKKALALSMALQLADYRISGQEKELLPAAMETAVRKKLQAGDKEGASYILAVLAQHAADKTPYLQQYFSECDYPGNPCRLHMLEHLPSLPLEQYASILKDEAEQTGLSGSRADAAATIIQHMLHQASAAAPTALATLAENPTTHGLLLTEQLAREMAQPTTNAEQLLALATQLEATWANTPAPERSRLIYAQYLCHHATTEQAPTQAIEQCRKLMETDTAYNEEARFLLAESLLRAPAEQSINEAEALYKELAESSSVATVQRALQALLHLHIEQKKYKAAIETTARLMHHASTRRTELMQLQAELYEKIGNLTAAINLYAQIKADNLETPQTAAPACLKMMQLLCERNTPMKQDKKNAKFYCSDKWYAWQQGREYAAYAREQHLELPAEIQPTFEQIDALIKSLGSNYDVQIEERDRPR